MSEANSPEQDYGKLSVKRKRRRLEKLRLVFLVYESQTLSHNLWVTNMRLKTKNRQMQIEKDRVEKFRYQQRTKQLEKAVTPFIKASFQC